MNNSATSVSQASESTNPLVRAYRGVARHAERERAAAQHAARVELHNFASIISCVGAVWATSAIVLKS